MEKVTPPYMSTVALRRTFDLLGSRNFEKISQEDLINRGFSRFDAAQSVQTLKFLGLIDSAGKASESLSALSLRGEERKTRLGEIVKEAYKDLFTRAPDANMLNRDELFNEFLSEYRLSARLATTAVPAFLWLCSKAGIETLVKLKTKEGATLNKQLKTKKQVSPVKERGILSSAEQIPQGRFNTFILKETNVTVSIPIEKASEWLLDGTLKKRLAGLASNNKPQLIEKENKEGD